MVKYAHHDDGYQSSRLIYLQTIVPCDTNVTVSMKFGGNMFDISPKTYNVGQVTNTTCVGGFSTTPTDTGEQSLLNRFTQSHVLQVSG